MNQRNLIGSLVLMLSLALAGCASKPKATETGFLSTYSNLQPASNDRMRYVSSDMKDYKTIIIDKVQFSVPPEKLSEKDRQKVADYFYQKLQLIATQRGLTITEKPGPGVARLRIAITGVSNSTWWMKLHPASRFAGAGTGGASMEAEIVDSVTNKQITAVVQASVGNQFNITAFSTVQDVESAIDKWVDRANKTLDDLRAQSQQQS